MIGIKYSIIAFICSFFLDVFPINEQVLSIIQIVAGINLLINIIYVIREMLAPVRAFHDFCTQGLEHRDEFGKKRYVTIKDFLFWRVGGAIVFWIITSVVLITMIYIRPMDNNMYRVKAIAYQSEQNVLIKTGFLKSEVKTIEYIYLLSFDEEGNPIETILNLKDKPSLIELRATNPSLYYYHYTDSTSSSNLKIKGLVKERKSFTWIFDIYGASYKYLFQSVYYLIN